jgi:hypothetical protein
VNHAPISVEAAVVVGQVVAAVAEAEEGAAAQYCPSSAARSVVAEEGAVAVVARTPWEETAGRPVEEAAAVAVRPGTADTSPAFLVGTVAFPAVLVAFLAVPSVRMGTWEALVALLLGLASVVEAFPAYL